MQLPKVQYFHQIRKGSEVMYGNKSYRVQEDRGYLHIIVIEDGKRTKKAITKDMFCEAGSMADYVFNRWFEIYTPEEFLSYAAAELNWLKDEI